MILDRNAYNIEMERLLSDSDTYQPLGSNPTSKYKKELAVIIERGYQKGITIKKRKSLFIPPGSMGFHYILSS